MGWGDKSSTARKIDYNAEMGLFREEAEWYHMPPIIHTCI